MTDERFGELHLVAYEPVGPQGFALPLFGTRSRANTLYVAVCRPSGDHSGRIAEFEPYLPSHHSWLPESLQKPAAIGGPWIDVFLWDGPLATGTPDEVWEELQPRFSDIATEAPLSLLDAAINAKRPEQGVIAKAAAEYVTARFGDARARKWGVALTASRLLKNYQR